MLKKIFNRERYISIHGNPWHFGQSWTQYNPVNYITPDILVGGSVTTAVTAFNHAVAPGSGPAVLAACLAGMTIAVGMSWFVSANVLAKDPAENRKCVDDYAIDRDGTSVPPENLPDILSDVEALRDSTKRVAMFFGGVVIIARSDDLGQMAMKIFNGAATDLNITGVAVAVTTILTRAGMTYMRCRRILNETYSICGEPPAPQRAANPVAVPNVLTVGSPT